MLPARRRINRRDEFAAVTRRGIGARGGLVVVHLAVPTGPPTPAQPARAGFVVSRAVGGSVVRHRVLRRLRAAMTRSLGGLPLGSLVVVRALPAAANASFDELHTDLDKALGKAQSRAATRVEA